MATVSSNSLASVVLPAWVPSWCETGRLIASRDWSQSALGPIENWPDSLTRTAQLCLESPLPLAVAWGGARVQLYNDAFARLCGPKHPRALGEDMRKCWDSAWSELGPYFDRAARGEGVYVEEARFFWDRAGPLEEAFATLSFSPVREPSSASSVAGVLLTVVETTARVLAERRTRLLRDVVAAGVGATGTREALVRSVQALEQASRDVPFALVYDIDPTNQVARLLGHTASAPPHWSLPHIDLQGGPSAWALGNTVSTNRPELVTNPQARDDVRGSPYLEPPPRAMALPLSLPGAPTPSAVLVAGQSPRLPLDAEYSAFFEQLGASVAAAFASAHALEAHRQRADELAALDHAKMAFFSNVTHELRAPLTLVAGPLDDELAEREQPLPLPRRERLAAARRNAQRLLKLVNTLLEFSRGGGGAKQARFRPTELGALTSDLVSLFRAPIERAGLTLQVEVEPLPEPVFIDRDLWEKIVLNLMSNALKHTFEGGIRVRLGPVLGGAELQVSDTGIGVAAEQLPRLFERFHRVVGAASRTQEGTGIGLSLVRELSRLHGGDVRVESQLGRGTTFTVCVPLGSAHLPPDQVELSASAQPSGGDVTAYVLEAAQWAPAAPVELSGQRADATPGTRRAKVLLADDNADLRSYVSNLLKDTYYVAAVADGQAALDLIPSFQPDLLLADVMMPKLGGAELLRAVRADAHWRTLPVILLSARAEEDASVAGLEAGADDYLAKPFSARELLARVKAHVQLARARRERATHLEQTNQELEAFSYSVSHDLRTPLRAIDGFSNALLQHKSAQLDAEGKQHLTRIRRAATRMSELIDELLNLSRLTRAPLRRQGVSITELGQQVIVNLRELHPTRSVRCEVDPGVTAWADPRLLRIVLENLLGNSWKFTQLSADARIRVGQIVTDDGPTYFVKDNGAGFNQAYAQRLFEPFQRLHLERDYPGTGIGLAIVHRIIGRHGGRVWAEGRENEGATFYFTLPEAT